MLVAADPHQTACELCEPTGLYLEPSGDLWSGFLSVENFRGYPVPAVSDADSMKLVGVVMGGDFISAYRRAVEEFREEQNH